MTDEHVNSVIKASTTIKRLTNRVGGNFGLVRAVSLCFAMLYGPNRLVQTKIRASWGEPSMTKYVTLFTYTSEAWVRMIQNPGYRTARCGGWLSRWAAVECVYWMLGSCAGIIILDVPNSNSGAALSVTVGSNGAFKNLQTHELLTQEELGQALSRSKDAAQAYGPPGRKKQ